MTDEDKPGLPIEQWAERTRMTMTFSRSLTGEEVEQAKNIMRERAAGRSMLMDESEWVISANNNVVGGITVSPIFRGTKGNQA